MIEWEEWAVNRCYSQVVSATDAECYERASSLLSPGDGGGTCQRTRIKSRALTHSSYGKTVRPQASLLTSLEPWFFHPKKWEGHETYRSVGLLKLNNL